MTDRTPAVIYGVAITAVVSSLLLALALIFGLASGAPILVFIGAAVSAGVGSWAAGHKSDRVGVALGSGFFGVVALGYALLAGFGWPEWSGIAGTFLSLLFLGTRWSIPIRWPGPRLVLTFLVMFLLLVLVPPILDGGALGHDEAAYALKARSWTEGTPSTGWSLHRGIGMSAYAVPILAVGGAEPGLRLLGVAGSLALMVAVWKLSIQLANPTVAATAAAAIVAGPAVLRRGTEYLSDIPSAALLLFAMMILWREFERPAGPTYRLLWTLPFAIAAFYLRYQSMVSIGLLAIVSGLIWSRPIRSRPGPVIATFGIGTLGLIPHALFALENTGSPFGILFQSGGDAVRDYLGQGLIEYAGLLPWQLAGFIGPIALTALALGAYQRWREYRACKKCLFLLVPAIGQILFLGIVAHGEPRFIFFPVALLVVAAAIVILKWLATTDTTIKMAAVPVLLVLLIGSLSLSAASARAAVEDRKRSFASLETASIAVAGEDCSVLTSYTPQVTFYSGCSTEPFRDGLTASDTVERLSGSERYMILVEDGKRQPFGGSLEQLLALTTRHRLVVGSGPSTELFEFGGD